MAKNNFDKKDYEGVEYTKLTDIPTNKKKKNILNKNKQKSPTKKIKKAQNFNFTTFLTIIILTGLIICFVVFGLTFNYLSQQFDFGTNVETESNILNTEITTLSVEDKILKSSEKISTGIIKEIILNENLVHIYDFVTKKNHILKYFNTTELKNQFDENLLLNEFSIGDIVKFKYSSSYKLISMEKSKNSFFNENISNFTVDLSNKFLKYKDNTFQLAENLLIFKNSKEISLDEISTLDTIDIKGIDNTILFILIKKSFGSLKFINNPNLSNATLEIDKDYFKSLNDSETLSLKEGKHKIVIRANGITPFVKEIDINSNKQTVVDLSEIQLKKGTLIINSDIQDYTIYINGVLNELTNSINLPYGTHTIKIEKEGYSPFETSILINKPQVSINVNLQKIEKYGEISISSSPTEAQVYIGQDFIGYTPLKYKLPYGNHSVTLKKEGYLDFNLSSINIEKNPSVFNITLHKKEETEQATKINTETTN